MLNRTVSQSGMNLVVWAMLFLCIVIYFQKRGFFTCFLCTPSFHNFFCWSKCLRFSQHSHWIFIAAVPSAVHIYMTQFCYGLSDFHLNQAPNTSQVGYRHHRFLLISFAFNSNFYCPLPFFHMSLNIWHMHKSGQGLLTEGKNILYLLTSALKSWNFCDVFFWDTRKKCDPMFHRFSSVITFFCSLLSIGFHWGSHQSGVSAVLIWNPSEFRCMSWHMSLSFSE